LVLKVGLKGRSFIFRCGNECREVDTRKYVEEDLIPEVLADTGQVRDDWDIKGLES
jgi:hypothetical protein